MSDVQARDYPLIEITDLTHDGRGVGRLNGKAVFVHGALSGEQVRVRMVRRRRRYDEGEAVAVEQAAPQRVEPRCPHVDRCGGCALQHLAPEVQIEFKQQQVLENLSRIGKVEPEVMAPALRGPLWAYRNKARLSVRRVEKKGRVLIGFRERNGHRVADCRECHILHPAVGQRLDALAELIDQLSVRDLIPQIEVAAGDNAVILVLRHMGPLSDEDVSRLLEFGAANDLVFYSQSKGIDTIRPLVEPPTALHYRVDEPAAELQFLPQQFTQINPEINRAMVAQAIDWLALESDHRVLDLFCGLGNFSIPLARRVAEVVGVEGEASLVAQAEHNARRNGLGNARFYPFDLREDPRDRVWFGDYDRVLLDPPRSGAEAALPWLAASQCRHLVYVSCQPASLARDAGALVHEYGFRLARLGVMDMFPHTAHVESMALFIRD
ncbi:MAG: 23S rRNA (uracil(1939)-C(5))-methyltransferase RlmD [Wenzhouxiangellaceae bacterium]